MSNCYKSKIRRSIKNLFGLVLLSFGLVFSSCNNEEDTAVKLNVLLVDDPADYQAVNVEFLGVSINYGGENEENGWQELETNSGVYNLLELTAGNEVLLVSNDIPAGTISQIRLLLGDQNSVLVDDEEFSLITPSGQESGVKLNLHQSFTEGIDYTIILDFDAARSVLANPVKYTLKPVIRASLEALNGAIEGALDPTDVDAVIYAIQDEDTVSSTYPNDAGKFLLRGISEGLYKISVDLPDDSTLADLVIDDVSVNIGEVTDLGIIILQEK